MSGSSGEESGEEEARPELLRHPSDLHPLEPDVPIEVQGYPLPCRLCNFYINYGCYSCTLCLFTAHEACAKAPLLIPCHPFHPLHPLSLSHNCLSLTCDACGQTFDSCSSYGCSECGFVLDIRCALCTLPNSDGSSPHGLDGDERQITIPEHNHPLTPFITNGDFYLPHGCNCALCLKPLSEDVYVCLQPQCKFLIHRRCGRAVYFTDGTRAPRISHRHDLDAAVADMGSRHCGECRDRIFSGELLGCISGRVFFHRGCLKGPEKVRYPPHPDHTLVLFICPEQNVTCQSCFFSIMDELCYSCTGCDFFLHAQCALQTLLYCKEGRAVEMEPSWHKNSLFLCHREYPYNECSSCNERIDGPAYRCKDKDCKLVLHDECTKPLSEIENHPHHPEHTLLLRTTFGEHHPSCNACCEKTFSLSFCCDRCRFYLHVSCASMLPSKKHYLHQHDLFQFEGIRYRDCDRCDTLTDWPLLRCVPCDFNLHEKCTELPPIIKHKTHHHDLTLMDFFVEDDTGEYYCDLCEKRRDERLGVYMCLECKMDRPWVFDIKCILPELQKVNVKKVHDSVMKKTAEEVVRKEEEVVRMEKEVARMEEELFVLEKKVEETKRELEELRKKHAELSLLKAQGEE